METLMPRWSQRRLRLKFLAVEFIWKMTLIPIGHRETATSHPLNSI